jgi:hypothetical protein
MSEKLVIRLNEQWHDAHLRQGESSQANNIMNTLKKLVGKTALGVVTAVILTASSVSVVSAAGGSGSTSTSAPLCSVTGTAQNATCAQPAESCNSNKGVCKDTSPPGGGCNCSVTGGGN